MMAETLEERVSVLEAEVARLKRQNPDVAPAKVPWWEQRFGAFSGSHEYEEASRAGQNYRESLRYEDEQNEEEN